MKRLLSLCLSVVLILNMGIVASAAEMNPDDGFTDSGARMSLSAIEGSKEQQSLKKLFSFKSTEEAQKYLDGCSAKEILQIAIELGQYLEDNNGDAEAYILLISRMKY